VILALPEKRATLAILALWVLKDCRAKKVTPELKAHKVKLAPPELLDRKDQKDCRVRRVYKV
jgi:hypothetical protein